MGVLFAELAPSWTGVAELDVRFLLIAELSLSLRVAELAAGKCLAMRRMLIASMVFHFHTFMIASCRVYRSIPFIIVAFIALHSLY